MFSKEEARKLRAEFWIAFGKSFPRKWILYKTGKKELVFKFHFDLNNAHVSLDIDGNLEQRIMVWEKLVSLKSILKEEFLPLAIYTEYYVLENKKEIPRIYVELSGVSIHNKTTWRQTMEFLHENMLNMEAFFMEYKEVIAP